MGSLKQLIELQESFDLQDVWPVKNSPIIYCGLDYFLICSNLQNHVTYVNVVTQAQTPDHKSIILKIC